MELSDIGLPDWLKKEIDVENAKYGPEYRGFLSNHEVQGMVALYKLGASQERIQEWCKQYVVRLEEKKEGGAEEAMKRMTENWKEKLGNLESFPDYLSFFSQQYQSLGVVSLLQNYLVDLVPGMWRAAFHCLIELGFGLHSSHPPSVVRGLAYLAASFEPLSTDLENLVPKKCPHAETEWDLFDTIRSDPSSAWHLLFQSQSGFQTSMKHLKSTPTLLAQYKQYCEWFAFLLLSQSQGDGKDPMDPFNTHGPVGDGKMAQPASYRKTAEGDASSTTSAATSTLLASRLRLTVMKLFVFTGGNDFFLLHGITAFHALLPCLLYLPSESMRLNALLHFAYFLLAVYLVQGVKQVRRTLPSQVLALLPPSLLPSPASLPLQPTSFSPAAPITPVLQPAAPCHPSIQINTSAIPSQSTFAPQTFAPYWNSLIKRIVQDYEDEHVIKLTWVAKWNFDRLLAPSDFHPSPLPKTLFMTKEFKVAKSEEVPSTTNEKVSKPEKVPEKVSKSEKVSTEQKVDTVDYLSTMMVDTIPPSLLFFLAPTLCSHLVSPSGKGWSFR